MHSIDSKTNATAVKGLHAQWFYRKPLTKKHAIKRIVDLIQNDIITLPPRTLEVTEPLDDSEDSGGEEIRGGAPYLMKKSGRITTPSVTYEKGESPYPISSNGSYPVVLYLCRVFVRFHDFGGEHRHCTGPVLVQCTTSFTWRYNCC